MDNSNKVRTRVALVVAAALGASALALPPSARASELRAGFSAQCPTTNYPAARGVRVESLALSVLSSVAGTLLDTGIAALKKRVNPENATAESKFLQDGLYVYRGEPGEAKAKDAKVELAEGIGCLVVAVGNFNATASEASEVFNLPFKSDRSAAVSTKLLRSALNLSSAPELMLYFEAAIRTSEDETAVTWQPVRIFVGEYLNDGFLAGKSRSTLVELRLYKPAAEKPFYSQDFAFDNVSKAVNPSDERRDIRVVEARALGAVSTGLNSVALCDQSRQGSHVWPFVDQSGLPIADALDSVLRVRGSGLTAVIKQERPLVCRKARTFPVWEPPHLV